MCDALQINWKLPSSAKKDHNNKILRNYYQRRDRNNNNDEGELQSKRRRFSRLKEEDLSNNAKYTLRACSIQKRIETESRKGQPRKRGPKPRPKPLPMSKYRRKTANQRERQRMGEINVAFEKLREKIPSPSSGKGRCEKMTKINILHVAINYIRALESILDTGDAGVQIYGTSLIRGPDSIKPEPGKFGTPPSPLGETSEDSGIVDEDENGSIYPDWTELTSTLDFPSSGGKVLNKDALLNALNNGRILQNKILNRQNSNSSTVSLSELLNNSGTMREDECCLFNDLNSSFESLSEGLVDFSHEDPFENLFF